MSRPSEFNQVVIGFKATLKAFLNFPICSWVAGVAPAACSSTWAACCCAALFRRLLPTVPIAAPTATEWLTSLPAISPTHYEFYSNLYKNLVFLANYRFGIMDGDSEFNNAV